MGQTVHDGFLCAHYSVLKSLRVKKGFSWNNVCLGSVLRLCISVFAAQTREPILINFVYANDFCIVKLIIVLVIKNETMKIK